MAKDSGKRTFRDQAGVGPDPGQTRHLMPLKEMKNFRISSGEPDIHGWEVYTSAGRNIGEVEDLLVDPTRNEVVMLDIDLAGTDRHSLAPIRAAWIDREHKRVVLDTAQLPADAPFPSLARHGEIPDDDARRFSEGYDRAYGDRGWNEQEDEWRVRRADEELRLSRRPAIERNERTIEPAEPAEPAELAATARTASDDVRVERHRVPQDSPAGDGDDSKRDIRYARMGDKPNSPVVIEETVVRRRVMDEAELSADEKDRLKNP